MAKQEKNDVIRMEQKSSLMAEKFKSTEKPAREHWGNQLDFILSMVGCCVGLGNLWRFPYVCNRNGGGAFLIPFLLCLILCGIPLYFIEICMGQFTGQGLIQIWGVCPLFKGVGYGMSIICMISSSSYIMVIAWTMYFMFKSFSTVLPWSTCGNWWNTEYCTTLTSTANDTSSEYNFTMANVTTNMTTYHGVEYMDPKRWWNLTVAHTSAEEFWQYNTLRVSSGIGDFGEIEWHLVVTLLLAWFLIFLCLLKGVRSVGKVVYVTATLPYILLIIILIRGLTLPGAIDGIKFYLNPDWSKLLEVKVWIEAAMQVFYSLGPAWGSVITLSSYNRFHSNCLRDSILITCISEGTSIFGGLVIFSVLGFMANQVGVSVSEVVSSGPGLAFVAYPQALALLPLPQLWCFLFFLMILSVGLDTQFCYMEVILSSVIDSHPHYLAKRRGLFTFCVCLVFFLTGLPMCTRAGVYIYQISDWYVGAFSLFWFGIIECIIFGWIYGTDRFGDDIEMMLGRRPPLIFKLLWKFITPVVLFVIMIFGCLMYKPPSYGKYVYPAYSEIIGWSLGIASFVPVPLFMFKALYQAEGSLLQRLTSSLKPDGNWKPQEEQDTDSDSLRSSLKDHTSF